MPRYYFYGDEEEARGKVRTALNNGTLKRPRWLDPQDREWYQCEDCHRLHSKIDAHHEDYNKPLDVVWLCRRCHTRRHAADRRACLAELSKVDACLRKRGPFPLKRTDADAVDFFETSYEYRKWRPKVRRLLGVE